MQLLASLFVNLSQYFRLDAAHLDSLHTLYHFSRFGEPPIVTCGNFFVVL